MKSCVFCSVLFHHFRPNNLPTSATFSTSRYVKLVLVCRSYLPSVNACGSPSSAQFATVSGPKSSSLVRASMPCRWLAYTSPVVTSKLSTAPSAAHPSPPRPQQHSPPRLLQDPELRRPPALALLVNIQHDRRAQAHRGHDGMIRRAVLVRHDSLAGGVLIDKDMVRALVRSVVPHAESLHARDEGLEERRERRREKHVARAQRAGVCLQPPVAEDRPFRLGLREDAGLQRGFFGGRDEGWDVVDCWGGRRDGGCGERGGGGHAGGVGGGEVRWWGGVGRARSGSWRSHYLFRYRSHE